MKVTNQELIQSYILTTAKYDFSVYEKRIMYKLVQIAQSDLQGKKLNRHYIIGENLFKDKIIQIKVKELVDDKNHARVKKALQSLLEKVIEYQDERYWTAFTLIQSPILDKYGDTIEFSVNPIMWNVILKIADKGFSKYYLDVAMKFNSVYAMRFYELFSNNLNPLIFSIDELKSRFGITEKYKNKPTNFIKRVIKKAKEELDEKSPYSFDFVPLKSGKKITAIKFLPYRIPENESPDIEKEKLSRKVSVNFDVPIQISHYMINNFGFDYKGLQSNKKLLKTAYLEFDDLLNWLAQIKPKALQARNPQAYVIGAMRKYLANIQKKKREKEAAEPLNDLIGKIANEKKIDFDIPPGDKD